MRLTLFQALSAFVSGLVFSFGLILSEMINPQRVKGFLDVFGEWDPSLIFVLGGAIPVAFIAVRIMRKMHAPVFAVRFDLPSNSKIDRPLILGSALFGFGWGIGGLCPAPALASHAIGLEASFYFVASMVVGMLLHDHLWQRAK